jgi:hypothetical protein
VKLKNFGGIKIQQEAENSNFWLLKKKKQG